MDSLEGKLLQAVEANEGGLKYVPTEESDIDEFSSALPEGGCSNRQAILDKMVADGHLHAQILPEGGNLYTLGYNGRLTLRDLREIRNRVNFYRKRP